MFVVRVWLPDRPGALGAVASRIGAVRGDLVGIDILETGAGRAIDELVVVACPTRTSCRCWSRRSRKSKDVDVEDVRPVDGELPDARVAALESAAELLAQPDAEAVCAALVKEVCRDFEAEWAAVVDGSARAPVTATRRPPTG